MGPQQDEENELQGPTYRFTAHPEQHVQSMVETEHFLVTGSCGEISGWDWKVITSNKASKAKVSWTINLPTKRYKGNNLIQRNTYVSKLKIINFSNLIIFIFIETVTKNQILIPWCTQKRTTYFTLDVGIIRSILSI